MKTTHWKHNFRGLTLKASHHQQNLLFLWQNSGITVTSGKMVVIRCSTVLGRATLSVVRLEFMMRVLLFRKGFLRMGCQQNRNLYLAYSTYARWQLNNTVSGQVITCGDKALANIILSTDYPSYLNIMFRRSKVLKYLTNWQGST